MNKYRIGDVVVSIADTCKMTIVSCINDEYYECVWFDENKLNQQRFHKSNIILLNDYIIINDRERKINNLLNF